ncbi:sugar phosphate nucleotidyltransferase [Echinicola jeungdonensis]|uniref:Mannose-1-phosphate guanylyltransferase n=1 Tax=Echinicola jeungdonensis TaxID=709343 RepID=A0ABV5J5X5_9BACT|nr:sugar phosphate nucleotidyltransferase [Echinicola jeungdonensis]MDN3668103.1 sugar phosphate nucleotidyltransferase [Echinicola jeungdonensis]
MATIHVILSGGVGSRLWPLSRKSRPKQYIPIFDQKTLFQKTVERNQGLCDRLIIVGNKNNYLLSREAIKKVGKQDFEEIIEACPRNTAAAIAFAALAAKSEDILFVTPSDHLIENGDHYKECVHRAMELAGEGYIVTFGLEPDHPDTGFGYIEAKGEDVLGFREKPNLDTAEKFLKKGNFLWNSGMFCFKAGVFLEELRLYQPDIFHKAEIAFKAKNEIFLDNELSCEIPSVSVDYAVMERTTKIKVVPSHFEWSDMGSFDSIFNYFKKKGHPIDEKGNMVIGTDIHTEFLGLKNAMVIASPDALLILQREKAQDVKKIFERLSTENPELVD